MNESATPANFEIKPATEEDVPLILSLIKELAEYERLSHQVVATEKSLRESLFGGDRTPEAVVGYQGAIPVGFALFFYNYSTFLGRRGMYLEDLYVKPEYRGKGFGRTLLVHLARLACQRNCGRLEWSVLDWNQDAITFYKNLGAVPMDDWTVYRLTGSALEELANDGA